MIKSFQEKFELLTKFEKKLPAISAGLEFLNNLELKNQDLEQVSANKKDSVKFFDIKSKKFKYYDYYKLNLNLTQLYEQEIILRKIIIYNKLYLKITESFNNYFDNHNYCYDNNMYNCYSIINKLFHCLRLSYKKKSDNFSLEDLLVNFDTKYFGPGVSKEEFYNFVLGFLYCLESLDILTFDKNSIKFNEIYSFDLKKAMYCSFDLMLLGSNNIYSTVATESCLTEEKMQSIYEIYKNSDEKIKMYIDDVLKCLVIATTVDTVSIYPEINNLLIELIFNNYLIEK